MFKRVSAGIAIWNHTREWLRKRSESLCFLTIAALVATLLSTSAALAQSGSYAATTAADAFLPVDQLRIRLTPLTRDELVVEADAWMSLLRAKSLELSEAEIRIKQPHQTPVDAAESAAAPPAEELRSTESQVVEEAVRLRDQRSKLIDRVNAVLDALQEKGGDAAVYKQYVAAVSGIKIDTANANATWLALYSWLRSEEGGMRWLKNVIRAVVTLLGFWIVARLASRALAKTLNIGKSLSDLLRGFLTTSVRRVILVIGAIVALSQLEVNVGPLMAALGAAGFVVAFALQGTLSNFASGLLILIYRPYDIGDSIDVAGVSGSVESMNLMSTSIATFDNKSVVVPNNAIWGDVITNITGKDTRRVDMVFGISYGDDTESAKGIIQQVLDNHELVLDDPPPIVRMHELGDSSINFICRPWVKTENYWTVFWEVTDSVKKRFDESGISIPFPQRDVHVHQVAV